MTFRRALVRLALAYLVVVSALLLVGAVVPVESGPLVIALILAPHLALVSVVLVPLAALARSRRLGLGLGAIALLLVVRLAGEWWSPGAAAAAPGQRLDVATWNVEAGVSSSSSTVALLFEHPVDIVVLEELIPSVATAIEADPALTARWPYRALFPTEGVAGIGLLSAFPITSVTHGFAPVRLEARVDVHGREVVILGAHPFPARMRYLLGCPAGFDPTTRNAELAMLRQRVLELDVQGHDVLLIGDFNSAPTEPAFARLTGGLRDAHSEVGLGPGWTWRPQRFSSLGIGLLRIDLVLTTSGIWPTRTAIDCRTASDHCLLEAGLALSP